MTNIKNDKATHTPEILHAMKIQPLTATSAKLMGFEATPDTATAGPDVGGRDGEEDAGIDDANGGPVLLSMKDLLTFGFTSDEVDSLLVSSHTLSMLQLTLQQAVLDFAETREKEMWADLVVMTTPPDDEDPKKKEKVTKSELLLRIPNDAKLKQTNDPNIKLYQLPETFKLVFFGTVGFL